MTVRIPGQPTEAALIAEYADVGNNWRFFIGLRAGIFGVFVTVNSALVAGVGWTLKGELPGTKQSMLSILASVAIIFIIGIGLTEYRIWRLFQISLMRGIELERQMSIQAGQYHVFKESERGPKGRLMVITYTRAMILIYCLIASLWVGLLISRGYLTQVGT